MAKINLNYTIEEVKIYDADQEDKVLSLLVANPQTYYDIARRLPVDDFSSLTNQRVYEAIGTLIANNIGVDRESIKTYLSDQAGEHQDISGIREGRCFETRQEALAYLLPECMILKRIATRRKTKEVLEYAFRQMSERLNAQPYAPIVEETIERLQRIISDTGVRSSDLESGMKRTLSYLESVWARQTWDRVPTGFTALDKGTRGGFRKKWLTVVGAITSKGKTAWMTSIIKNLAHEWKILAFTLEQDEIEILTRIIAAQIEKQSSGINSPEFTTLDQEVVRHAAEYLGVKTVHVCDERNLSIDQVIQEARVVKAKHGLDLVFVDYLQLLEVPAKKLKADLGEEREARYKIRALHKMAKDLNVAVVVFSQFSRKAEDGVVPQQEWLKDSSQIEQSADQIFLIWSALDDRGRPSGFAVRVAKDKAGPKDYDVELQFDRTIPVWKG